MEVSYINEDYLESNAMFMCADKREYFYENMDFIPVSILNPIIWEDEEMHSEGVFDITNSGDLSVTKDIAEVILSFDPYGVLVLNNTLCCFDGLSKQRRYIIAINNELDIADLDKSSITKKTVYYDPELHGYDVPIDEQTPIETILVHQLYLDENKLKSYPENRRHVFRVKGTNNFFFSAEVYDELYKLALKGLACGLIAFKFDTDKEAPRR